MLSRKLVVKVAFREETRRIELGDSASFDRLKDMIAQRFSVPKENFVVQYKDEDEELVAISTDDELGEVTGLMSAKGAIRFYVSVRHTSVDSEAFVAVPPSEGGEKIRKEDMVEEQRGALCNEKTNKKQFLEEEPIEAANDSKEAAADCKADIKSPVKDLLPSGEQLRALLQAYVESIGASADDVLNVYEALNKMTPEMVRQEFSVDTSQPRSASQASQESAILFSQLMCLFPTCCHRQTLSCVRGWRMGPPKNPEDCFENRFGSSECSITAQSLHSITAKSEIKILPPPPLMMGGSGEAVRSLNGTLAQLGYIRASPWTLWDESIFDSCTYHALTRFQGEHQLEPNGIFDAETHRVISARLEALQSTKPDPAPAAMTETSPAMAAATGAGPEAHAEGRLDCEGAGVEANPPAATTPAELRASPAHSMRAAPSPASAYDPDAGALAALAAACAALDFAELGPRPPPEHAAADADLQAAAVADQAGRYPEELAAVLDMGFGDVRGVAWLLEAYRGDVDAVVGELARSPA